jgi:hypothetical protein
MMEPLNKKQRQCETLPYPPEAIAEIEELRCALRESQADRDQLQARVTELEADRDQLRAQVSERDANVAMLKGQVSNLEGALNALDHEESSVLNDSDFDDESDGSSIDSATGLPYWGSREYEELVKMVRADKWPGNKDLQITWEVVPYIVQNINEFCGLLRGNAARRAWVDLDSGVVNRIDPALYHQCMAKFGEALGNLQALHMLYICAVDKFVVPASIVEQTRQIRSFEMQMGKKTDHEKERDYAELMASALRDHPLLEDISLSYLTTLEADIIAAALPTLPKLRKVYLNGLREESSQPLGPEAICHILRIQTLREATFCHCTISESGLSVIAECLGNGSLLSKLSCLFCDFPTSSTAAGDLVAAVKRNYALEKLFIVDRATLSKFANLNQQSVLVSIPWLNKAGRRYLKDDPRSVAKGFQVLRKVMDDKEHTDLQVLDCLFLHLRENPLLCKDQEVPQQSGGLKRKGDESMKKAAK